MMSAFKLTHLAKPDACTQDRLLSLVWANGLGEEWLEPTIQPLPVGFPLERVLEGEDLGCMEISTPGLALKALPELWQRVTVHCAFQLFVPAS